MLHRDLKPANMLLDCLANIETGPIFLQFHVAYDAHGAHASVESVQPFYLKAQSSIAGEAHCEADAGRHAVLA